MPRHKDVFTTGEVAAICKVAPRTVSKWFDSGKLRGYRIPGSKDRRIPAQQLIRFMRAHGIPLDGLETGLTRVLIVEQDRGVADLLSQALARDAGYDVYIARSAFEAGLLVASAKPHLLLLDEGIPGFNGRDSIRELRALADLGAVHFVAVTATADDGRRAALLQQGYDAVLCRPLDVPTVVKTIEGLTAQPPTT